MAHISNITVHDTASVRAQFRDFRTHEYAFVDVRLFFEGRGSTEEISVFLDADKAEYARALVGAINGARASLPAEKEIAQ